MFKGTKRLVLLLALALLPTQGIAMALSGLVCNVGGEQQLAHVAHSNDGHDTGPHSGTGHDDDAADVHYENFSCNHLVFVLPAVTLPATVPDITLWVSSVHTLSDLFVPERPQRPPLA